MHRLIYAAVGGLALALAGPAMAAEKFPDRPIRLVVPFPPGGNVDVFARVLYLEVEKNLGATVVIDNRGGANGLIGADIVKNATPNGYTLLNVSFSFAVNPAIRKDMPFDIEKDFVPVTNVALGLGYLMVANPKTTIRTVQDVIDQSKTSQLRYSTAGVGNGQHLAGALFSQAAGIKMLHVPYKGGGPAAIAAVSGEVQIHFPAASVGIPHHKAGRLRAIAFTGEKRLQSLPNVPTIGETVKGFVFDSGWHGVFAPAGTPMARVRQIQQAIHKGLQVPHVHKHFTDNGYEPQGDPPQVWAKKFRADVKRFAEAAKAAGIEPN